MNWSNLMHVPFFLFCSLASLSWRVSLTFSLLFDPEDVHLVIDLLNSIHIDKIVGVLVVLYVIMQNLGNF